MVKRTRADIRGDLLKALSDGKPHTYGDLERQVDTNWQTIRDHCADLELFEAAVNTPEGWKITARGREVLKKIQNSTK